MIAKQECLACHVNVEVGYILGVRSVVNEKECKLGQWIATQSGNKHTQTKNWNEMLKVIHLELETFCQD